MRKSNSDFKASFVSEPGTFITNKSYFAFVELDDIACWIAADGLDSDEEKESAKLAVHRIFEEFIEKPSLSRLKIKECIMKAHELLQAESRNVRLKAGFIMLVTDYSKAIWAMAGNLRLYHFRKGIYNFRSKDQSIAQLMVDSGKISETDLNDHEERNNLVNYLGKSSGFKPFISRKYRLRDGDTLLLCNSGFWENMTTEDLSVILRDSKEAEEMVDNLEDALLEKQNEVLNNYTIGAICANKVFQEKTIDYPQVAKRIVMIVLPLLMILGIGLVINRQMVLAKIKREALLKIQAVKLQKKSVADFEHKGDLFVKGDKYQEATAEYQKALDVISDKNLKLPDQEELINKKLETSLLIVDGDNFYTGSEYSKANEKYYQAMAIAAGITYDKTGLMSRLERVKNVNNMKTLVQEGDNLVAQRKYEDAREKYQLAKTMAEQLANDTQKAMIDSKLVNLEQKITESNTARDEAVVRVNKDRERDTQIYQARRIEKMGDDKYLQKQYKEAAELYKNARNTYLMLGLNQETALIDGKISDAEKKANRNWFQKIIHGK